MFGSATFNEKGVLYHFLQPFILAAHEALKNMASLMNLSIPYFSAPCSRSEKLNGRGVVQSEICLQPKGDLTEELFTQL